MPYYIITNGELYHHGVKGMKWGQRKRQGRSVYKSARSKAFSKYEREIDSIEKKYKIGQNLSKKDLAREARAEARYQRDVSAAKAKYKSEKQAIKAEKRANTKFTKDNVKKAVNKGAKVAATLLTASLMDDIFAGGAGKRAVGTAVKQGGRKVTEAIYRAKGHTVIGWQD